MERSEGVNALGSCVPGGNLASDRVAMTASDEMESFLRKTQKKKGVSELGGRQRGKSSPAERRPKAELKRKLLTAMGSAGQGPLTLGGGRGGGAEEPSVGFMRNFKHICR